MLRSRVSEGLSFENTSEYEVSDVAWYHRALWFKNNVLRKKIKAVYNRSDYLPKFIDAEDIPRQSLKDYYIKLEILSNVVYG